jgi:GH24 family phage-related lysozyme (muramidase)
MVDTRAWVSANVLTIGGAQPMRSNHFDSNYSMDVEECHQAFLHDMEAFEKHVRKLVTTEPNQHQYDSLVSFRL